MLVTCVNPRCGKPLPPSYHRNRQWCSDACRMAVKRAGLVAVREAVDGPVTAAVTAALADYSLDAVDSARRALALSLAREVDGGGQVAVSASRELRAVLDDLGGVVDPDTLAFWESIRTPVVPYRS